MQVDDGRATIAVVATCRSVKMNGVSVKMERFTTSTIYQMPRNPRTLYCGIRRTGRRKS